MGEVVADKVLSFSEARREKRERDMRQEMRALGIQTRELALLQRESMMTDSEYWHKKATVAKFLNNWLLELLRQANERHAQSKKLLAEAEKENERLRALVV